jgi:hypothetical protein
MSNPKPDKSQDTYSDEEIARRYDATLKRVLTTPPQHRTAKGEKVNPPKKRGRPKKNDLRGGT